MDYLRYYLGVSFMIAGIVGFVLGGPYVWLGAATFPLVVLVDLFALKPDYSLRTIKHPRLADVPLYLHAASVPMLVFAAVWRLRQNGSALTFAEAAGIAVTSAWLGVVPNVPVAHEFLHRHGRLPRFLALLCTLLIVHPVRRMAHVGGHHFKFGLVGDTDTPYRGESIYAFWFRAAVGGTKEALRIERRRAQKQGYSLWSWRSDLVHSLLMTFGVLSVIYVVAGLRASAVILTGWILASLLLESFNYLQHYGLIRVEGGKVHPRHSWNHLTPVVRSAAMEITVHSHHHDDMQVPFYALEPDPDAPQMPSALICFMVALIPPLWERVIAMPKLRHWDMHFASDAERKLAAKANADAGWPDWIDAPAKPVQAT